MQIVGRKWAIRPGCSSCMWQHEVEDNNKKEKTPMPASEYLLHIDPHYAILRTKKLSSFTAVRKAVQHNLREIDTPNADQGRTRHNKTFGAQNSDDLVKALKGKLPAKRRKDAVLCIEYLVTASPEWFASAPKDKQNDYFRRAVKWVHDKHGSDRVLMVSVQVDENTPHVAIFVVPLTPDNRLSARHYFGTVEQMRDMQTDFAEKVGRPVGLARGVSGGKLRHETASAFAREIKRNPLLMPPALPAPSMTDRLSGKSEEMEEQYREQMAKFLRMLDYALAQARLSREQRRKQAAAIKRLREEAEEAAALKAEAEQIRIERERMVKELDLQRSLSERVVNGLRGQLAAAEATIEKLRDQVVGLKDQVRDLMARLVERKPKPDDR